MLIYILKPQKAIILVSNLGTNIEGCGNSTNPCETISFATQICRNSTAPACTVSLLPGTYQNANNTNFFVPSLNFTLTSERNVIEIQYKKEKLIIL